MTPSASTTAPTAGPTDVAAAVAAIARDQLGVGPIGADTDLRTLDGVDSLRLLRLVTHVEEHFGVELDDAEVFDAHTVGAVAALVREQVRA